MQFKGLALVASAFVFAACGGSGESTPAAGTPADTTTAAAVTATMAPATGTTHEVKMVMENNMYHFVPANLTIKAGDAVKYVTVSGGPHNVVFDGAALSAAVKAQLDANFGPERMAGVELTSNMFMNAGEGITISFANVPAGAYSFNCTPHLAMGMKGVITVQ